MTPLGTSVLATAPVDEFSTTSAPPVVAATMPGEVAWRAAGGLAPGLATAAVLADGPGAAVPALPPLHAASSMTAAGSAAMVARISASIRARPGAPGQERTMA